MVTDDPKDEQWAETRERDERHCVGKGKRTAPHHSIGASALWTVDHCQSVWKESKRDTKDSLK